MKKTIVILLALVLAGPSALRADPQDELKGKVVRISGSVNGLGVVLLYKADICIILEDVDGSQRQAFDLKDQDYRLEVLADSLEIYFELHRGGLASAETPAGVNLAPAVSAFVYLSEIAARARKMRFSAAFSTLTAGGVVSVMGIYAWAQSGSGKDEGDDILRALGLSTLASGLFVLGVGAVHLSLKTSAERTYDQAQKLSDGERNAFCAAALKKEARKARIGRYINAALCIGLASFSLKKSFEHIDEPFEVNSTFSLGIFHVLGFSISALYNILYPSYEEKMDRRYLEGKTAVKLSNKLVWKIGQVPRGFALGVNYCF